MPRVRRCFMGRMIDVTVGITRQSLISSKIVCETGDKWARGTMGEPDTQRRVRLKLPPRCAVN